MDNRRLIASIEDRVGFGLHRLDKKTAGALLNAQLKSLPKESSPCSIKTVGFKGMCEPGLVCGYTNSNGVLKALVIYTDRPRLDGLFDYEIIDALSVKAARPHKPARDVLTRFK